MRTNECVAIARLTGYTDTSVVEERSAPPAGSEQLIAIGVENYCLYHLTPMRQCDRHCINGEPMKEVGRSVERIDYPLVLGDGAGSILSAGMSTRFFSQERVIRISCAQNVDDGVFDGPINFRDIILGPFARHLQTFKI